MQSLDTHQEQLVTSSVACESLHKSGRLLAQAVNFCYINSPGSGGEASSFIAGHIQNSEINSLGQAEAGAHVAYEHTPMPDVPSVVPPLSSLTPQQISRIAANRAAARAIKHQRISVAMSSHERSDLPATPDELAPISHVMYHSNTTQFRRKFFLGKVARNTALANTARSSASIFVPSLAAVSLDTALDNCPGLTAPSLPPESSQT